MKMNDKKGCEFCQMKEEDLRANLGACIDILTTMFNIGMRMQDDETLQIMQRAVKQTLDDIFIMSAHLPPMMRTTLIQTPISREEIKAETGGASPSPEVLSEIMEQTLFNRD